MLIFPRCHLLCVMASVAVSLASKLPRRMVTGLRSFAAGAHAAALLAMTRGWPAIVSGTVSPRCCAQQLQRLAAMTEQISPMSTAPAQALPQATSTGFVYRLLATRSCGAVARRHLPSQPLAACCSVEAEQVLLSSLPQLIRRRLALEQLSALPRSCRRNNELPAGILVGMGKSRGLPSVVLGKSAAKFQLARAPLFSRLFLCRQLVGSSARYLESRSLLLSSVLAVASALLATPVACVRAVPQEVAVVSVHLRVPSCPRQLLGGRLAAYRDAGMPTLALEVWAPALSREACGMTCLSKAGSGVPRRLATSLETMLPATSFTIASK